jgi:hypothetical protein
MEGIGNNGVAAVLALALDGVYHPYSYYTLK